MTASIIILATETSIPRVIERSSGETSCSLLIVLLNQFGYPDMSVRIGSGENVVIQDGWDIHTNDQQNNQQLSQTAIIKEPHYDIIGYSTNIAVKITGLANTNGIVIGHVYDVLDREKSSFKLLEVNPNVWKYIDNRTGAIYRVHHSS